MAGIEDELRYAAAASIVGGGPMWVDVGCGDAGAAVAALTGDYGGSVLLVHDEPDALADAAATVGGVDTLLTDLASAPGVAVLVDALAAVEDATVTCFSTIERLPSWVPLVDALVDLAESRSATVVLSVPDDERGPAGARLPGGPLWGPGEFQELRRLLPPDAVVARQLPLLGSAIVVGDAAASLPLDAVQLGVQDAGSHMIVAFGPRAHHLVPTAGVAVELRRDARLRERDRDAALALAQARLAALGA